MTCRIFALFLLTLSVGCSAGRQAKLHATVLTATHTAVDTSAGLIEDGCVLAVERASSVERAREVATGCRRAAEVQHSLVEAWMTWASAVLVKLEGKKFDLGIARGFASRALNFYRELDELLVEFGAGDLPDLPPLVLELFGE
jgi:hypothetical protein